MANPGSRARLATGRNVDPLEGSQQSLGNEATARPDTDNAGPDFYRAGGNAATMTLAGAAPFGAMAGMHGALLMSPIAAINAIYHTLPSRKFYWTSEDHHPYDQEAGQKDSSKKR